MSGPERRAPTGPAAVVPDATVVPDAPVATTTAGILDAGTVPTVTGVDGCAAGWVAVTLGPAVTDLAVPEYLADPRAVMNHARTGRAAASPVVTVTMAATLDLLPLAAVTGIDMPLGLLGTGWRDADLLARRALGRRGVTVFAIPPRAVWECPSYAEANRLCRELTGKGFSVQAWGLRRKIIEADQFRRRAATGPGMVRLLEVHPELSFTALAGAPLPDSKHTRAGLAIRRGLLAGVGIDLPFKVAGAAENDLLDAAAVAWSARRIAAGAAVTLTSRDQPADDGTEIAIRY
jgi:predicted RNase H-like nuclease